ncbi:MAG: hypothetical protein FJ253_11395 [Phycisphaerae bacterium]|nr:hypothetical protein [Phycisphaerae bacterium]
MRVDPDAMHETLAWVLNSESACDWSIADHMARELDPRCLGAIDLITSGHATLETLVRAKALFKTLRLEGETAEDRQLGSQLYAGAIAAAIVGFGEPATRQRPESLRRAFVRMQENLSLPPSLRQLARRAERALGAE